MIADQIDAATVVQHNTFQVLTIATDDGGAALVFVLPGSEAHLFEMSADNARAVEDGLCEARTKIKPATVKVPHGVRNGRAVG